ncbi:hypothetical protein COW36_01980 [bacterium (Candidatus Blackallbacteria) CG17_big_fil_post_rev_8_21_14_2_50_48_46]|uniref:DUF2252 domain-containing protein n=1 Tax=bacterium (Candidatus Blackallbacteria) CG17_big_fil_post_rev_8_21_14_2_50_48_46 TaxID=2014261 RepID=A0A2M7GAL8_9BACT|nr:MAG: hypothetical protein COW64_26370 [bacterium (Candidatus Blackallbacteria) CG18_big_fil_WC_8_21_14_2_50_49_26]PIW19203.1 MAG: hypothetical protein COW36_01980 [bacterium (Candidatus Blackallbacteria) CG17_big_fil_post_rev_8_21_14_2_50_48_46]PIW45447.1 MAG: hypothetical protein COW20_20160 [bacterium (Candidatus Blackallbacteria) CG13_big_fil_rev_8_21_14_2_50_49_14]
MKLRSLFVLSALATLNACQSTFSDLSARFQQSPRAIYQTASKTKLRSTMTRDPLPLIQKYHLELQKRAPEWVRLKYEAMSESPFAFYRATAFLFDYDMARETALASPTRIWIQGDFHLENMGTYKTSRNRFAYDLNDFDEATQAPYTWELARQAVSIQLAADENGFKGSEREALVGFFLERYLFHLQALSRQPALLAQPLDQRYLTEKPAKQVEQAANFNRAEYLSEMTRAGRFIPSDKILPISPAIQQEVAAALTLYARTRREGAAFFRLKDAAARVAGKGSLGRYRYIVLVEGASASPQDDIILEFKEAASPSTEAFAVSRGDQSARILQAFRYFLPEADPFLGVSKVHNLSVYVRELLPKETVNLEKLNKNKEFQDFLDSVALIGARAHARSGQAARILAESKTWLPLLPAWSDQYAGLVSSDWETFVQAVRSRRL